MTPFGLQITVKDGWITFAPPMAMAKDGEDDDDDDNSGSGHGGSDDDDESGSGNGGSDNSGPGNGGSGNSGPGNGGTTAPGGTQSSGSNQSGGQVWTVAWYQVSGQDIEVHYTDGWTERIVGTNYLLIDERNRVAISREVRAADRARLAPLFR